ncbi:LPS-assembly protein LptD [Alteraurantiacibacter buctensis]|uniref:LPS-assembly protein LptD n=1 Tax=Alteraurantiacibacter buctensis TaxID=1503981 RepID=A0A844Z2A7_9SPHN|nr:LPS assembly protein LptD [Alteraurantiacibacter buctensis]MXO72033.1 LPS assembly protein LptD [Alteraurantiacibacter buctensis]
MLPPAKLPPQGLPTCLSARHLLACGLLGVSIVHGAPVAAQDQEQAAENPLAGREIAFEADGLAYDNNADTVTATGNVLARSGDQSVRADAITWNRTSGEIVATGNVQLVDDDGNQLFTERLELTDELKAGAMSNMLLAFRQGGRLAADMARRDDAGDIVLDMAAYSSCAVVDAEGCPRDPSWRVTARRVFYDSTTQRIRFEGAHLELFGAQVLPLPGLVLSADGSPASGVLMPDAGYSASNGFELSQGYYWRLAENRDLTLMGYFYTGAVPMVSAQYRQLNQTGAFQVSAYGTYSTRIPLNSTVPTAQEELRGYLFTNGRWQLDPNWSVTGSLRVASDRTFLRRYDITREDRLRSTFNIERIDADSYLSISGWATQALLIPQDQKTVPLALPLLDYRLRLRNPVLGGRVSLQANTLAITRAEGQDTQRAFVRAQWDMRRITPLGQEVTLTALVRGDAYNSDQNLLTQTPSYRGLPGWQMRGVATTAVDVKWPLLGDFLGGTQVITPRVQLVATPPTRNLAIPNEDARAIDLEDSNLFALNRFAGYDRVEDGVRMTYGLDWQANLPGWRLESSFGQSYRLTDRAALFPDGTGLNEQFSDFVGRSTVRYRDVVKFTHRFRLDKDNLAVRRNEIDATFGNDRNYVEVGYLRLNRDVDVTFEDLQDREELRVAGRVTFARYWSVFGSAVTNLTNRAEDPTLNSDGFEPLRTRLGVAYSDDCLEMSFTWRRDFVALADARRGNSFRVNFSLRNIGFR